MVTWWEREAECYRRAKREEKYEDIWKEVRKWRRRAYCGWVVAGILMIYELVRK